MLDRSKFKATSVAATIQKDQELNNSMGRDGGSRTDYLKLDQGANLIRIYPPHPEEDGGGDAFAEPKVTVFLPMMVVQKDDRGQEMIDTHTRRPILKESVKSVFNSRIHGNTPKDLVEEYVAFSRERLEEDLKICQDPKIRGFLQSKIESITGNFNKKIQGLKYKTAWVMYVDKIVGTTSKFGMLEIGPGIKDRLNSLAASTDTASDPLATDPFTDIENGRAVIITYNKEAQKAQDYYKTELDNVMMPQMIAGKTYQLPRIFPISDDQLEKFCKVTPLAKRFKGAFKKRDFQLQFEGLEFFDTKHQIGTFEDPRWVEICKEIAAYYPEDDDEEPVEEQPQDVIDAANQGSEDLFAVMNRLELSTWLKQNKTGILVKPTMSDEDLRTFAREWVLLSEEQSEENQPVEEVPEIEKSETVSSVAETSVKNSDVKNSDRLAELRKKMRGEA